MEQSNSQLNKVLIIFKWIFSVVFFISTLGALVQKSIAVSFIFLIIALLLFPPLVRFWRNKIPFLNNKLIKGFLLLTLFTIAGVLNKRIPKDTGIKMKKSRDILITYIKNDTIDKSIKNLRQLENIGKIFNNGNYSIKHHYDEYITGEVDSVTKQITFLFNPKYNFDKAKSYLADDYKNGMVTDYIMKFEVDSVGNIVSKKTFITYSKIGKIEYNNDEVPNLKTLVDEDAVEIKKTENEAQRRLVERQKMIDEFEKKCFSSWDGSNRELVKFVKNNMNDPKSFEHVKTNYWVGKDYAVVEMQFRGKNAFNAVVTNVVSAKINLEDCTIISVE